MSIAYESFWLSGTWPTYSVNVNDTVTALDGGTGYRPAVLASSPTVYWTFDEASGNFTDIVSGKVLGNDGTAPTYSSAPLVPYTSYAVASPTSISMAGTSLSRLSISSQAPFTSQIHTAEFWYSTPHTASTSMYMLSYGTGNGCYTEITSAGALRIIYNDATPTVVSLFSANGVVPANTACHIVITYTGTAWKAYVNGVLVINSTATYTAAALGYTDRIGDTATATKVDEFAFYTRELTQDEVLQHYGVGTRTRVSTVYTQVFSPASSLQDDFSTYSSTNWVGLAGGGSIVSTGTTLRLTPNQDSKFESVNTYNFTNDSVMIEVPTIAMTSDRYYLALKKDANNSILIQRELASGNLYASIFTGGVRTNLANTVLTDAQCRFLRMRSVSGVVYYDYSADGLTWTNLSSTTPSWSIAAVKYEIYAQSIAGAGYIELDNLNLANYLKTVSDSVVATDSNAKSISPAPTDTVTATDAFAFNSSMFRDDFSSGTFALWPNAAGTFGTYSVVGGRARLETTSGYSSRQTDQDLNLIGSSVSARVWVPGLGSTDGGSTGREVYFRLRLDSSNMFLFYQENTSLILQSITAGVYSSTTITYNATTHAYWRIRELSGTVYWETSSNGLTWTTQKTLATPAWTSNPLSIQMLTGYYGAMTGMTPSYMEFDDVDVAPSGVNLVAPAGGNWSSSSTWVTGVVPTSSTDVYMDSSSGNLTIDATAACRSLDCTGYTGTITHNSSITLSIGSSTIGTSNTALRFSSGMTYSPASFATIAFVSTNATQQTIDFAGKTIYSLTFNGAGSSYVAASAIAATGTLTLAQGILDLSTFTHSVGILNSTGTLTRTLTMGSSTINLTTGSASTISGTGLTVNPGTSLIATTANPTFDGGLYTFNDYSCTPSTHTTPSASPVLKGTAFNNVTINNTSSASGGVTLRIGSNLTIGGTLTTSGAADKRVIIVSDVTGTARTLTVNNLSVPYSDWGDITAAGAANWNLSAVTGFSGDMLGNTGITLTTGITNYYVGSSGSSNTFINAARWATTSGGTGGTGRIPLPQDDVVIDSNSGTGTTFNLPDVRAVRNLTISKSAGVSWTEVTASVLINGDFILSGATSIGAPRASSLRGRGNQIFNINNLVYGGGGQVTFDGYGGKYTLAGPINWGSGFGLILASGELDSANYNISVNSFTLTGSKARILTLGTSTVSVVTTSSTLWDASGSNITGNLSSSTIVFPSAAATARTFNGGGLTYGTVTHTVAGSTGQFTISGSNTFNTLNFSDASNARTLAFSSGTTQTFTGAFNVFGTAGKLMTLSGVAGGSAETLVFSGSGAVSSDYLSVSNLTASPVNTWYAGNNSVDGGGNSGWNFSQPPLLWVVNDSVVLTDSVTSATAYAPTFSDSVVATDSYSDVWSAQLALSDTAFATDSTVKDASQITADAVVTADSVGRDFGKPVDDAVTATDSVPVSAFVLAKNDAVTATDLFATAVSTAVGDSVIATDTAVLMALFDRSVSDNALATDLITTQNTVGRQQDDLVTATDTAISTWTAAYTVTDTATAIDNAVTAATYFISVADSVVATDSSVRAPAPAVADSVTATDFTFASFDLSQIVSDTALATDGQIFDRSLVISDSVTATDSPTSTWTASYTVSDAAVATDLVLPATSYLRSQDDPVVATDTQTSVATYSSVIDDIAFATDSFTRAATFDRAVADTTTLSDSISNGPSLSPADSVTATDSFSSLSAFSRDVTDYDTLADTVTVNDDLVAVSTVTLTDDPQVAATQFRSVDDAVSTSDTVAPVLTRVVNDVVSTLDTTQSVWTADRTFADTATALDTLALDYTLVVADGVTAVDTATSVWVASLSVPDAVNSYDEPSLSTQRPLDDSVVTTDVLRFAPNYTIVDAVTIADDETTAPSAVVADSVTTTDSSALQPSPVTNDSVVWFDFLEVAVGWGKAPADTVAVLDVVAPALDAVLDTVFETATVTDSATAVQDYGRAVPEVVPISDTVALARGYVLLVDDFVDVADTAFRSVSLPKSDPVTTADTVAVRQGYGIAVDETVSTADTEAITLSVRLSDDVTASDLPLVALALSFPEIVPVVDNAKLSAEPSITDSVQIADGSRVIASVAEDDTFTITDAVTGFSVTTPVTEVVPVADAITQDFATSEDEFVATSDHVTTHLLEEGRRSVADTVDTYDTISLRIQRAESVGPKAQITVFAPQSYVTSDNHDAVVTIFSPAAYVTRST